MLSIIPGIEIAAPERTETSSGFSVDPNVLPVFASSRCTAASSSSPSPSGKPPLSMCARQASVVTVKPLGTGRPEPRHLGEPDPLATERAAPTRRLLVEVVHVPGADCREGHRMSSLLAFRRLFVA